MGYLPVTKLYVISRQRHFASAWFANNCISPFPALAWSPSGLSVTSLACNVARRHSASCYFLQTPPPLPGWQITLWQLQNPTLTRHRPPPHFAASSLAARHPSSTNQRSRLRRLIMRGVHTFWTFKPGELFIILHTTTREEFYCVLKRLKSSMKRARRVARLLGGGGLMQSSLAT